MTGRGRLVTLCTHSGGHQFAILSNTQGHGEHGLRAAMSRLLKLNFRGFVASQLRMSSDQLGELGKGAGKGGGGGGTVREAGGAFGKKEAAEEERYFKRKEQEQLAALRKHHEEEIDHHKKEIERLQQEIDRHKGKIRKLKHDD